MSVDFAPADTTLEAARVQMEIYRSMTPARRWELTSEMSDFVRTISADGVRSRHPEYSEAQVQLAVIRISLGKELFGKAYPGVEIEI